MFYIQTLKLKKDTFQALLITHRFFSCLTEIQRESRLIRKKVIPLQRRAIHPRPRALIVQWIEHRSPKAVI